MKTVRESKEKEKEEETYDTSNLWIFFFGYKLKVSSNQTLNKKIASEGGILANEMLRSAEYKERIEIQILSGNGSGTTVITLDASNCNNRISRFSNCIGHQEFQFPHFVSTQLHSRKIVALQPHFRIGWQVRKVPSVNRSRKMGKRYNMRRYGI